MSKIKPILIIRLPYLSDELKDKVLNQLKEYTKDIVKEYHLLMLMESYLEKIEFECLNVVNATKVTDEEIRKLIKEVNKNF